jgi:hypothetical protein
MRHSRPILIVFAAMTLASSEALACRYSPLPPSNAELHRPMAGDMIAVKAVITRISPVGTLDYIPHEGFTLHLRVTNAIQGVTTRSIRVMYGGCDYIPGNVGGKINVIARKLPSGELMSEVR